LSLPYSFDDLVQMINSNYGINIIIMSVLVDHTYSKVYLLESATDKYVLKEMGESNDVKIAGESELTGYLVEKGIKVPKLYHSATGSHIVYRGGYIYVLYEFIDGKSYGLNTAPDWFLRKSARTLGNIQAALKDYKRLPPQFGRDFFASDRYARTAQSIAENAAHVEAQGNVGLATALNERLKHIRRVLSFRFDCDKLSYVNSHGDFYINQVIVRGGELFTLDWSNPHYLLACFEVMMSYAYAAPECVDGSISVERFYPYFIEYLKYAPITLNKYDLKMMPYFIYHYCIFCSFTPPYDSLPNDYYEIAHFTDRLANWLHDNVDGLSVELQKF